MLSNHCHTTSQSCKADTATPPLHQYREHPLIPVSLTLLKGLVHSDTANAFSHISSISNRGESHFGAWGGSDWPLDEP